MPRRIRIDDMNTKDFLRLGVPLGQATRRATDFISKFILGGGDKSRLHEEVAAIVANPSAFVGDPLRGEFAKVLLIAPPPPVVATFCSGWTPVVVVNVDETPPMVSTAESDVL